MLINFAVICPTTSRSRNGNGPTRRVTDLFDLRAFVLTTEHAGPHLDEFGLVEISIVVSVEHVDEVERHGPVETHQLLKQRADLLLAQQPVTVSV